MNLIDCQYILSLIDLHSTEFGICAIYDNGFKASKETDDEWIEVFVENMDYLKRTDDEWKHLNERNVGDCFRWLCLRKKKK